jgi:hypothetical protein
MEPEQARKDLREGNIVSYMIDGIVWPVVVKSIHQGANFAIVGRIENLQATYQANFYGLIPVSLTEKRLEKLNFFNYCGKWINNGCRVDCHFVAEISNTSKALSYVHELQNFFEDNRGEKLPLPKRGKKGKH